MVCDFRALISPHIQICRSTVGIMSLRFNSDGTFRVLQMADIQDGPDVREDTIRLIEAAIKKAHPDLIVLTGDQIRLIQNNDTVMVEKIQTTIVNTIPLWKSQMVLALGIAHSAEAAQAQRQVTDITNELLRKNAETLHMATVETAKESERGIVDLETLQKTNADLIQTLDDVMRIQMEGRQKRQAAEMEMHRMEEELKRKLLEIR